MERAGRISGGRVSGGRISGARRAGRRNTSARIRRAARRARFRLLLVLTAMVIVTAVGGVLGLVSVRDGVAEQLIGAFGSGGPSSATTSTSAPARCKSAGNATPASGAPCGATPSRLPTASPPTLPYSHSWYVDDPDAMSRLGTTDAQWLNTEAASSGVAPQSFEIDSHGTAHPASTASSCAQDFLTVLDFGHPTRLFKGNASPLDDYAMTLFGVRSAWRTYRQVEQLTESYLDAWMAAASHCVHLHLVLGANNYFECRDATIACDVATAGAYWDVVTHDVLDYVAAKGYGSQIVGVWVGDDLETSWDPWTTTATFLSAVQQQEATYTFHAALVDYGDAAVGACSIVTKSCKHAWSAQNVYDAAWGIGWNVPLPETYDSDTLQRWLDVGRQQRGQGPMSFAGVMTECAGTDPLPSENCHPQRQTEAGPIPGTGPCQWSPNAAFTQVRATDLGHALTYATNIQWADTPTGDLGGITVCP
ncbi:MAG TPA: hypothetical protein VF120_10310 [Ktedonobacterales bacterium]